MTTHSPRIVPNEWRRVALFAALIVALVVLPYAVGWERQTDEMRFTGAVMAADDVNSYLGKMRLGARGIWDFYLFYTPEAHDPVPGVFLPYIAAGQLVGLFYSENDPALTPALIVVYHAMRIAFTLLLIVVLYRFIAHFLRSPAQRMTALILSVVGGGFGWLLLLLPGGGDWLGSLPPDVFIPEGFGFLIPLTLPHLALARALLLLGFLALFGAMRPHPPAPSPFGEGASEDSQSLLSKWRGDLGVRFCCALFAALCWAGVGIIVPFYLAVIYCLLAAWGVGLIARANVGAQYIAPLQANSNMSRGEAPLPAVPGVWKRGWGEGIIPLVLYGGIAAGLTLPLFAYYALAFAGNPAFAAWSAQNLLPAPHPLQYLVAYSLFIALGAFALHWAWRRGRRRGEYILLIAWVLAGFVLVYLPINVQRRMSEAIIVPLAILATHGLDGFLNRRTGNINRRDAKGAEDNDLISVPPASLRFTPKRGQHGRLRIAVIALASLTSVLLFITTTFGALSLSPPVFIPRGQVDAFAWLDANTPPDARILASMPTGNLIPANTHLRPYVGHGPETLGALAKEAETERFYADRMSADERAALYESVDIRYVFYGANERALAGGANVDAPAWADGLMLVYEEDGVRVYVVGGG